MLYLMGNLFLSMIDGSSLLWMAYVFIVSLVTQVNWNYSMGGGSRNPKLPGSRLGRWESW